MAAIAEETTTPLTTAPTPALVAPQTLTLIQTRMKKAKLPERTGMIALNADGTPLWKSRAYEPFIPASTMKVLTAVVALDLMGKDWKPVTRVVLGDDTLFLVGGGDPLLSSSNLKNLAQRTATALATSGATPRTLRVDDSLFPTPTLAPGVHPSLQPQEINPVRPLIIDRRIGTDSAAFAARQFATYLAGAGVPVTYAGRGIADGTEVASFAGTRLQGALRTMLWYSDNDIAEMVFRLSSLAAGRSATWADARVTAYETLARIGVPTKDMVLVDGSGLSRNNRLSAFALADVLRIAATVDRTVVLRDLMPAAGVEGTVRTRFRTEPSMCVRNDLKVKTGGLHDVVSLAGYAPVPDGTFRPFAIIVNNLHSSSEGNRARRAIDTMAASFSGC